MSAPTKQDIAEYVADMGRELASLARSVKLEEPAQHFEAGALAAYAEAPSSDDDGDATSPPGS